jgi:hypothetical protein
MTTEELAAIVARDAAWGHDEIDEYADPATPDALAVHALLALLRECRTALRSLAAVVEGEFGPPSANEAEQALLSTLEGLEP